ncbi:MAG: DNA repair protein [Rhodocyclales bacterium]|nr:DNA repair protein [Rhodocyclales bacterium]
MDRCFTDTGYYEALVDCANPQRIIIGRTGAGKSALIQRLKSQAENVIEIAPEELSLNFLSNSDILQTLTRAGVKLDIFYALLWKHVFAVELLKEKFGLLTEEKTRHWLTDVLSCFRKKDQTKERALAYLRDWGDKFWEETEYRIKEVTERLENSVKAQLGADLEFLRSSVEGATREELQTRAEIVHRAQRVINDIQVKALSDVLKLLADDVFEDPQENYFIVIDKLDEGWIDDTLRYRLIRALIETVRAFRAIPAVKIVVALRQDLIQSVFDKTRDAGFQEEKYQSLFLSLRWDSNSLLEMLDKRVRELVREQYTSQSLGLRDVFPPRVGQIDLVDYLLTRTLLRPRDAIAFVNECLRRSEGKGAVTVQAIRDAEVDYATKRINSLTYEWMNHFPLLRKCLVLLERMPTHFKLSSISKDRVDELALDLISAEDATIDPVAVAATKYLNGQSMHAFIIEWTKTLFHVGIAGIKPDGFTAQLWEYADDSAPTDGQIKPSSILFVHPMVWARLGVVTEK